MLDSATDRPDADPPADPQADDVEIAAQYMMAEDTKLVLVRIYDRRTGRTIRVIPPTIMVSAILKLLRLKSVTRLERL